MNNFGVFLKRLGNLAEAEQLYRRAIAAGDTTAMISLGMLLEQRGDLAKAEHRLRRAVHAGHGLAALSLAQLQQRKGGGRADRVEVRAPGPVSCGAKSAADELSDRALSELNAGRPHQANDLWEQVLRIHPGHMHTVYNRGLLRWRAGDLTDLQLLAELKAARASHDDDWLAEYLGAMVHLERGDSRSAARLLRHAARRAPGEPDVAQAQAQAERMPAPRDPIVLSGDSYLGRGTLSADKRVAVTTVDGRNLGVWATETGRRQCILTGHDANVRSVALSADGRLLVSGDEKGSVRVWDTRDARCERTLSIPVTRGRLTSVAVSADGRVQVIAVTDGSVRVCDDNTGHGVRVLGETPGEYPPEFDVTATTADDGRLVTVFDEYRWHMRVWDRETGTFQGAMPLNRQFAFSAGGAAALAITEDKRVRVVDFRTEEVRDVGSADAWGTGWVAVTDDGRVGFVQDDTGLQVWGLDVNRCVRTINLGRRDYFTVSGDGRLAMVGEGREAVHLLWLEQEGPPAPWSRTR